MEPSLYWATLVAFLFGLESIRDFLKMRIDIRTLYTVLGITLMYLLIENGLLLLLGFLLAFMVVSYFLKMAMTEADRLALVTLLSGHAVMGTALMFAVLYLSMHISSWLVIGIRGKDIEIPGFPLLTISHMLTLPLIFY